MNRALNIIVIGLLLVLTYVAYSAMQGLTHHECLNPACKCEPCKCGRLGCHCRATPAVPVVVTPEPQPIEEDQRPLMRAYVVGEAWCEPCRKMMDDVEAVLVRDIGWRFGPGEMLDHVTLDGARLIFPSQPFPNSIPFVIVAADGEPVQCLTGVTDKPGGKVRPPTAAELGTLLNEAAAKHGGRWR